MELKFITDDIDRNKYLVTENGFLLYTAVYDKSNGTKNLFDADGNLLSIGYYLETTGWWRPVRSYAIEFYENNQKINWVIVKYRPWWRPFYSFSFDNKEYEIIEHFGSKLSIFENHVQIGYYVTGGLLRDPDWEMKLVANSNIKKDLWCMFCLHAYSDFMSEHGGDNPSFNLSPQRKRFDKKWRPK